MMRMTSAAVRAHDASERYERASRRDRMALERDEVAARRDRLAEETGRQDDEDRPSAVLTADAMDAAASVRTLAAEDRKLAGRDREEAARDREEAKQDRELLMLEIKRSHIDEATGAYRRQTGEVFLRHEIDRARRAKRQLVLGLITTRAAIQTEQYDVDSTQAALFRDLFLVLRMRLRPYDPIVRWDQGEFVCAIAEVHPEEARSWIEEVRFETAERHPKASITVGTALDRGGALDGLVATARGAL